MQLKGKAVQKSPYSAHFEGGFGINSPDRAVNASASGVQVVFRYNQPPSESDLLGQKLKVLHMKVMDGFIASSLSYYECHRTKTIKPPPQGQSPFCQDDTHPELNNEQSLLAVVTDHLKQVKDNQLIMGYWVLDDWVLWDAGSAKDILIHIRNLVHQYTPHRPVVCGFGGTIWVGQGYGWNDATAENFTPQGCDMVGLYIYASTVAKTTSAPPSDTLNWPMEGEFSAMFASLQDRGWDIQEEPLIGIGQAFGGPVAHADEQWVIPNAKNIETQSRSFCEHGATALTFYGWDDSDFGPATQTPMNSTEIQLGIRNGIAACKAYWSTHPQG